MIKRPSSSCSPPVASYEIIPHTADFGIWVFGASIPELFCNAGYALADLITETDRVSVAGVMTVVISGMDWPDLMVNWLRELLYLWAGEEKLICRMDITDITEYRLTAEIKFDYYDSNRHRIRHEIKAVTYHQIQVVQQHNGFFSQIIFDV
jgi:SHS2 domain-containing protein